ncbi:hypothetical protein ACJQWK_06504 [Exserohilum turcicum]
MDIHSSGEVEASLHSAVLATNVVLAYLLDAHVACTRYARARTKQQGHVSKQPPSYRDPYSSANPLTALLPNNEALHSQIARHRLAIMLLSLTISPTAIGGAPASLLPPSATVTLFESKLLHSLNHSLPYLQGSTSTSLVFNMVYVVVC